MMQMSLHAIFSKNAIGGRHLGWINKRSARNFSRDRMGSPPRSVVFTVFGTFTWSLFSSQQHLRLSRNGRLANRPLIVQFTNILANVCSVLIVYFAYPSFDYLLPIGSILIIIGLVTILQMKMQGRFQISIKTKDFLNWFNLPYFE